MRKLLLPFVAVGLLAACGGGDDDPSVDATDDGSTTSSTLTVGTDGSSTTVTIGPGGSIDPTATTGGLPTADTTPIDPATVETLPPAPDPGPSDPGFPPADTGQYTYATTGTAGGRPINEQRAYTVTALSDSEIRYAAPDQILDLQYRPDGVYVRQMVSKLGGYEITFQSADGVLLIPIPQDPGRTWDWTLTDSTGGLTAVFHGTTQPAEAIAAGGAALPIIDGTIDLTGRYDTGVLGVQDVAGTMTIRLWVDQGLRLPAQLHQVTTITKPALASGFGSDTTSTYTGFTPA